MHVQTKCNAFRGITFANGVRISVCRALFRCKGNKEEKKAEQAGEILRFDDTSRCLRSFRGKEEL